MTAQVTAGLIVVVIATVPTLILSPEISLQVTEFILLALVCVVSFIAARQAGGTTTRAFIYSGVVLGLAIIVLLIKSLAGH